MMSARAKAVKTVACVMLAACTASTGGTGDTGADNRPASAKLSVTALDFGASDCGGTAPGPKTLTITNEGGRPLGWTATLDAADIFAITGPANGSIPGGGTATITVTAKAVAATATAGALSHASLLVSTDDTAHAAAFVPVTLTAQGATFMVTPAAADFGQIPINNAAPDIALTIKNVGNKAASVALAAPANADFTASWTGAPMAGAVAPGAALDGAKLSFTPTAIKGKPSSTTLTVTGAQCGTPPNDIVLSGEGTNGVVGVSPGKLDFGLVDCGKQGPAQSAIILNTGNAPITFKASLALDASSPYAVSPPSGTVLPGNQVQLLVTPKTVPQVSAITPNLYGDTLTITTSAAGDMPHAIDLQETARGAIITTTVPSLAFAKKQVGTTPTLSLGFVNAGNTSATLSLAAQAPYGIAASLVIPTTGASTSVSFSPPADQLGKQQSGEVSYSTSDALCAPLPAKVAVTGTPFDIASKLSTRGSQACALGTSGTSYCWGNNFYGQLGNNTTNNSSSPTPVLSLAGTITAFGSGNNVSCARRNDGTLSCWGFNLYGQLGDGTNTNALLPVSVQSINDATASVDGGYGHTCAVRAGGGVACFGYNFFGQLGNSSTTDSNVPVAVTGIANATAVAAGTYHACALLQTGAVQCWGYNIFGQLGNNTTTNSSAPVNVMGLVDAVAIGAGSYHSCAVRKTGAVVCWGYNFLGQLGNNTTTNSSVPVAVSAIADGATVSCGSYHSCAVRQTGAMACWGYNFYGQLGNGGTTNSSVPVAVTGIAAASAAASGDYHNCALITGGTLQCWGNNSSGQLGNSKTSSSSVPVGVTGF